MALVLPNSVFLHVPKAAGWWVRHAVRACGIPAHELGHEHASFKSGLLDHHPADWWSGKLVIAFVRHPLRWYQSVWAFRMKRGWKLTHPLDYHCASNDFNQFVRNALEWCPTGWVTGLYSDYVDAVPPGVRVFVGRQERLAQDLTAALDLAGERYDPGTLLAVERANTSDLDGRTSAELAVYGPGTAERVLAVESAAVARWYPPGWDRATARGRRS